MILALVLAVIACHYAQETTCGHHALPARCSLAAAGVAYATYAILHALAG
jgi:hypothetical protein